MKYSMMWTALLVVLLGLGACGTDDAVTAETLAATGEDMMEPSAGGAAPATEGDAGLGDTDDAMDTDGAAGADPTEGSTSTGQTDDPSDDLGDAMPDAGAEDDDQADDPVDAGFEDDPTADAGQALTDAGADPVATEYSGIWEDETGDFQVIVSENGIEVTVTKYAWSARVMARACSYTSDVRSMLFANNVTTVMNDAFTLVFPESFSGFAGTIGGTFVDASTLELMIEGVSNDTAACPPMERVTIPVSSQATLHPVMAE